MPYKLADALNKVTKKPKKFHAYTNTKAHEVFIGAGAPSKDQLAEIRKKLDPTGKAPLQAPMIGLVFRDEDDNHLIFTTASEPPDKLKLCINGAMTASKCKVMFDL